MSETQQPQIDQPAVVSLEAGQGFKPEASFAEKLEAKANEIDEKVVTKEFEATIGMTTNQAEDEATKFLRENGFTQTGDKI